MNSKWILYYHCYYGECRWLHNNGTLKVLVQFIVKKDIFYFVHKCLRRWMVSDAVLFLCSALWVRKRWRLSLTFQGPEKTKDASLLLPQTLNQDPSTPVKVDFLEERALVYDEIYKLRIMKHRSESMNYDSDLGTIYELLIFSFM